MLLLLRHFYGDSKSSHTDNLESLLQAAQAGLVADLPLPGFAFTVPLLPISSWLSYRAGVSKPLVAGCFCK